MSKLVIEQLTIFETLNTFDADKAYWKNNKHCYIKGLTPRDALSPFELDNGIDSKRRAFYYELWEHHAFAIWSYLREQQKKAKWEDAVEILKEHRDKQIPVFMKINYETREMFIYTQVTEYLA